MRVGARSEALKLVSVRICLAACLAGCAPSPHPQVSTIDIVAFGELEYGGSRSGIDPTSPIGAQLALAQGVRVSHHTDRIPLRQGVAYGVAFVVRGSPPGAVVAVRVVLRSSAGCVLKATGKVVYENESTLQVRIGELRHIGGRIVAPQEDHCVGPPAPGTDTFELRHGGKKLAEKRFDLVNDSDATTPAASKPE
jgi:hypothetical protein